MECLFKVMGEGEEGGVEHLTARPGGKTLILPVSHQSKAPFLNPITSEELYAPVIPPGM